MRLKSDRSGKEASMKCEKQIRIRLVKSPIGARTEHKATVRALGLRRMGQEILKKDSPSVRGMVESISYLVEVTEEEDGDLV